MRKIQIGIIGPEEKNICLDKDSFLKQAYELGKKLAEKNAIIITGGCTGVAESASKGAFDAGGITIGTPGPERGSSVESTTIEICTPINVGDFIFAGTLSSDVLIVFPGDAGTIAELAIAYRYRKPLLVLRCFEKEILKQMNWNKMEDYPLYVADSVDDLVLLAIRIAQEKLNKLNQNIGY